MQSQFTNHKLEIPVLFFSASPRLRGEHSFRRWHATGLVATCSSGESGGIFYCNWFSILALLAISAILAISLHQRKSAAKVFFLRFLLSSVFQRFCGSGKITFCSIPSPGFPTKLFSSITSIGQSSQLWLQHTIKLHPVSGWPWNRKFLLSCSNSIFTSWHLSRSTRRNASQSGNSDCTRVM